MTRFWLTKSWRQPTWLIAAALIAVLAVLLNLQAARNQADARWALDDRVTEDSGGVTRLVFDLHEHADPTGSAVKRQLSALATVNAPILDQAQALFDRRGTAFMRLEQVKMTRAKAYQKRYGQWLLAVPEAEEAQLVATYRDRLAQHQGLEVRTAVTRYPDNVLLLCDRALSGWVGLLVAALVLAPLVLDRLRPDRAAWLIALPKRHRLIWPLQAGVAVSLLALALAGVAASAAYAHWAGQPLLAAQPGETLWRGVVDAGAPVLWRLVLARGVRFASFTVLLGACLQATLWQRRRPVIATAGVLLVATLAVGVTAAVPALQQVWNPAAWLWSSPTADVTGWPVLLALLVLGGTSAWLGRRLDGGQAWI